MKYLIYFLSIFFLIFLGINFLILDYSENIQELEDLEKSQTALVLGARVYESGRMSDIFKDRIDSAIELYSQKKVNKILISGDHGRKEYDEVNAAKKYILGKNIKEEDIFLDHAGFDTYDSIYRAKEIFKVRDVIIITQNFHLPRALYIADNLGIKAQGYSADLHNYMYVGRNNLREFLARVKAFYDVNIHSFPKFLGPVINIEGDGRLSWD